MPRAVCLRCRRPVSVCYCAALTTIETATRVVILQHPREKDMPIGTARMASLCLPRASVHVGLRWDDTAVLREATGDPSRPAILLYPGPGARDVLRDPPKGPVTLVVVDGTWSQTKSLVRHNPALAALPRYAFTAPQPSDYRIRREPCDEYVSTIEALMHVLGALEGDPERFRALLVPFRAMVDAQLDRKARSPNARVCEPRERGGGGPRLPQALTSRFEDVVLVAGEANAWPYASGRQEHGDELIHWVARRLATGETFDAVAAPQRPLSVGTLRHSGLSEERLRTAPPRADLFAAFARFVRPSDLICSWGTFAPRIFAAGGGTLPDGRLDLRVAARTLANAPVGAPEVYLTRIAAPREALAGPRAVRRIETLVRIVETWRAQAPAATS